MPNSNNPPDSKPTPYTIMQLYKDLGAIMCDTPAAADIAIGCDSVTAYITGDQVDEGKTEALQITIEKLGTVATSLLASYEYSEQITEKTVTNVDLVDATDYGMLNSRLPIDKGVH